MTVWEREVGSRSCGLCVDQQVCTSGAEHNLQTINVGEGMEKREFSYIVGGSVN